MVTSSHCLTRCVILPPLRPSPLPSLPPDLLSLDLSHGALRPLQAAASSSSAKAVPSPLPLDAIDALPHPLVAPQCVWTASAPALSKDQLAELHVRPTAIY